TPRRGAVAETTRRGAVTSTALGHGPSTLSPGSLITHASQGNGHATRWRTPGRAPTIFFHCGHRLGYSFYASNLSFRRHEEAGGHRHARHHARRGVGRKPLGALAADGGSLPARGPGRRPVRAPLPGEVRASGDCGAR